MIHPIVFMMCVKSVKVIVCTTTGKLKLTMLTFSNTSRRVSLCLNFRPLLRSAKTCLPLGSTRWILRPTPASSLPVPAAAESDA